MSFRYFLRCIHTSFCYILNFNFKEKRKENITVLNSTDRIFSLNQNNKYNKKEFWFIIYAHLKFVRKKKAESWCQRWDYNVTQQNNPHSRPETYVAGIFKHSIASNQVQINQRVSFLTTIKTRLILYLKRMLVKKIVPKSKWLASLYSFKKDVINIITL